MLRILIVLAAVLVAQPGWAETRKPSHCLAIAQDIPAGYQLIKAGFRSPLEADRVRIHYVTHATFLIETTGGLTVATDYAGFLGHKDIIPDVITMNVAHETHHTYAPDPRIPYVLRGWNPEGGPAVHHLDLGEMLVRNVPTNIRDGFGGVRQDGNSIFVFEVAGLCIGHLGHLHHEPDDTTYAALGRLDVVMAPVDGGMTLPVPKMIRVLKRLKSSVVLPMHWFGDGTLSYFLDGMEEEFQVVRTGENHLEVSLATLPRAPTVMLLMPRWLRHQAE